MPDPNASSSPNPYNASHAAGVDSAVKVPVPRRWAVRGFVLLCLPCMALGMYGLYADAVYAANLQPGQPHCGNPAMLASLLVFPVGPFLGFLGAGVGYISALVCDAATCRQ